MKMSVFYQLQSQPELIQFVRYNPKWYRYLMRDPEKVRDLPKEAKKFYGKTLSQRLEKFSDQVRMVDMMIKFAGAMKD